MTIHLVYADYGSTGVFEVEPRYIKDDKLSAKPTEDRAKMFRMEDIVGVCDTDKKAQTAAKRFSKIELAPKKIEGKVEKITSKIERIEAQRDKVEERVDSVGERSNELEESHFNMTQKQQERFDKLCAQYDELSAKYDELDSQIAALENEQATLEEYQELSDAFAFETKDYLANGCLRQILTMGIEDRSDKPYAERIIEEIKEPVHPVAFEEFVPTEIQANQFPPKIEPTPTSPPTSPPTTPKQNVAKGCLKSIGYVIIILILYFIFLGMFDPFNQEKTSEPPKVEQLKKVLKETPKEKVVEVIPVDPLTLSIDEMTMSDGVTLHAITFSKITNGKIIVKHSDGAMRIKMEELPDAVRARIATE